MNPPRWLNTIPLRLRSLFLTQAAKTELDEELAGRDFNEHDNLKSGSVGIIDQTMARNFFDKRQPDAPEIQHRFQQAAGHRNRRSRAGREIRQPAGRQQRHFYVSGGQESRLADLTLHARTIGDARIVVSLLRQTLQQIDPNVPLDDIKTLESQLDDSLARDRLITWLSTAFGVRATLLATIGLYGVIAFSVTQRTREIGIRMALGAQRLDVLRLILRQVALLVLIGLVLGTGVVVRRPARRGQFTVWNRDDRSPRLCRRGAGPARHRGARSLLAGAPHHPGQPDPRTALRMNRQSRIL